MSLSDARREFTLFRFLLSELGAAQKVETVIRQDNAGAIRQAQDVGQFGKHKHIKIRPNHVGDLLNKGIVDIKTVGTRIKMADVLSKPLHGPKPKIECRIIGLYEVSDNGGASQD